MKYQTNDEVLSRLVGETLVLFQPETERLVALNECGTRIWQLMGGGMSVAEVTARLMEEYEGPAERIQEQVRGFLSELEGEKVIERVE